MALWMLCLMRRPGPACRQAILVDTGGQAVGRTLAIPIGDITASELPTLTV